MVHAKITAEIRITTIYFIYNAIKPNRKLFSSIATIGSYKEMIKYILYMHTQLKMLIAKCTTELQHPLHGKYYVKRIVIKMFVINSIMYEYTQTYMDRPAC